MHTGTFLSPKPVIIIELLDEEDSTHTEGNTTTTFTRDELRQFNGYLTLGSRGNVENARYIIESRIGYDTDARKLSIEYDLGNKIRKGTALEFQCKF